LHPLPSNATKQTHISLTKRGPMVRQLSLLLALVSVMACDPFRKAERRIDRPNGKTSDSAAVQASVQRGSQQTNSQKIIDATTGSLALPFEALAPRIAGLDELLANPEIRAKTPYAATITNLTRLAMANTKTPYALKIAEAGTIDTASSGCSGLIDFTVAVDLDGLGARGDVEVQMTFNNIVCPDGSIDGLVALKAKFNALQGELKIINIVEALVSDNVETEDIDFAFRLDAKAFSNLALDMSVKVDDDFFTLSIEGDLVAGTSSLVVKGKDGELTCTADATTATASCDAIGEFAF
jgi:hypothetical protein